MLAFARVNGKQYYIDEGGEVFCSSGLSPKKVKINSIIIRKIIKRLAKTISDREERAESKTRQLEIQIRDLNDQLDVKVTEIRRLKSDLEDKVGK